MFKLKSGPVGWMTILLGGNEQIGWAGQGSSLLGGDKTGSNHHLLMGWWRRKNQNKEHKEIPEVEKESDFIESKEETIVRKRFVDKIGIYW